MHLPDFGAQVLSHYCYRAVAQNTINNWPHGVLDDSKCCAADRLGPDAENARSLKTRAVAVDRSWRRTLGLTLVFEKCSTKNFKTDEGRVAERGKSLATAQAPRTVLLSRGLTSCRPRLPRFAPRETDIGRHLLSSVTTAKSVCTRGLRRTCKTSVTRYAHPMPFRLKKQIFNTNERP